VVPDNRETGFLRIIYYDGCENHKEVIEGAFIQVFQYLITSGPTLSSKLDHVARVLKSKE
jgi:hypothetical protein